MCQGWNWFTLGWSMRLFRHVGCSIWEIKDISFLVFLCTKLGWDDWCLVWHFLHVSSGRRLLGFCLLGKGSFLRWFLFRKNVWSCTFSLSVWISGRLVCTWIFYKIYLTNIISSWLGIQSDVIYTIVNICSRLIVYVSVKYSGFSCCWHFLSAARFILLNLGVI